MGLNALVDGTYGNAGERLNYRVIPQGTSKLEVVVSNGVATIARDVITPYRLGGLPVATQKHPANVIDIRTKLEHKDELSPHGIFGYTRRLPTEVQLEVLARCFPDLSNTTVLGVSAEEILAHKKPLSMVEMYQRTKEGAEALVRLPVELNVNYDNGAMAYSIISIDGELVMEGMMYESAKFRSLVDYLGMECDIKNVNLTGNMSGKDELILNCIFRKHMKPNTRMISGASVVDALIRQQKNKIRF